MIEPGLTFTKTASAAVVLAGSDVTYTFVVTNTGDVGLDVIGPTDDQVLAAHLHRWRHQQQRPPRRGQLGAPESGPTTAPAPSGCPTPPATDQQRGGRHRRRPARQPLRGRRHGGRARDRSGIHLDKTVSTSLVPGGRGHLRVRRDEHRRSPIAADDVLADVALATSPCPPTRAAPPVLVRQGGRQPGRPTRPGPAETWRYACTGPRHRAHIGSAWSGARRLGLTPPCRSTFDVATAFVRGLPPGHRGRQAGESRPPSSVTGRDLHLRGAQHRRRSARRRGRRGSPTTPAPRTYVSGDDDGDGLLDTATASSRTALDETWIFTCATTQQHDDQHRHRRPAPRPTRAACRCAGRRRRSRPPATSPPTPPRRSPSRRRAASPSPSGRRRPSPHSASRSPAPRSRSPTDTHLRAARPWHLRDRRGGHERLFAGGSHVPGPERGHRGGRGRWHARWPPGGKRVVHLYQRARAAPSRPRAR